MLKAIPKVKTVRDKKYLAFIRKQSCCVCGKTSGIVPHHSSTGGMGIKGSDLEAVPVCAFPCHALVQLSLKEQFRIYRKSSIIFIRSTSKKWGGK
jgi:hypothetical protein